MTPSTERANVVVEEGQRLSQSRLWQLQRAYFAREGLAAWREGDVPYYITNNPSIARSYAQVIFGWLRDLAANTLHPLDLSQPIYLVELGAGSGKFAYHFLKFFLPLLEASTLKHISICYVMTDFTSTNLAGWQEQPQLKAYAASGKLDFALFDAEHDQSIILTKHGETLTPAGLKNPLAVIANYVFDSLTHDVFRFEDAQMYESLVNLLAPEGWDNWAHPQLFEHLKIGFEHRVVEGGAYDDAAYNEILDEYRQTLQQTHLLLPVGALASLQLLRHFANDRLLVIAGDKGYHLLTELDYRAEPSLVAHGSFSLTVNFHALGQYAINQGGVFLSTPHRQGSLDVCAFLFDATMSPAEYLETSQAYRLAISQGGPDDFFIVKRAVESHYDDLEIVELLAYLRQCGWDSNIFVGCFLVLIDRLPKASDELKGEVDSAIQHVWANYYFMGEEKDVPFALGLVSLGTENYVQAARFMDISLRLHGSDSSSHYYLGLACYHLGALEEALVNARASSELNPRFEPALTLARQVQHELSSLAVQASV